MIIDCLDNSRRYESLNPLFKQAFDYLKSLDYSALEPGRTVLVEDALIVMVNDSTLKAPGNAKLEVHNEFIDIQVPVSRPERYGWKCRCLLEREKGPFDSAKDCQLFDDDADSQIELKPGGFAIFFPEDGHAPCIGEGEIRKIIVKVRIA